MVSPPPPVSTTFRQGENGYAHVATFLRGDQLTWNSGQRDQLLVGKLTGGQALRAVFSYDLSALPPSSAGQITSALLEVWTLSTNSPGTVGQLQLRTLLGTPVEGSGTGDGATWTSRTGTVNWSTAGGDFSPNSLSVIDGYLAAVDAQKSFPSTTALVQAVKTAVANGVPLDLAVVSPDTEAGTANSYTRFHSDEAADLAKRPRLTITTGANPNLPVVSTGDAPANSLGARPAALAGSSTNSASLLWSKVSGPGSVVFTSASSAATEVTFDRAGDYVLRLTTENNSGKTSSDLAITVTPNPAVFTDWQQLQWPGVTDPATIGAQADPDQDGLANLAEFALGLPPLASSQPPLSISVAPPSLVVTYARSRHATGVNTSVEWSDLLAADSWSTSGISAPAILPPDTDPDRVFLQVTLPSADRRFVRLKISSQP